VTPPFEERLNLAQFFQQKAKQYGSRTALLFKRNGTYRPISWAHWSQRVKKTALGLYSLGVCKGDRVAILSENRPEWAIADFAILSLGAVTVPIYITSSSEDIRYIMENAGVRVLFLSCEDFIRRTQKALGDEFQSQTLICFDSISKDCGNPVSQDELEDRGRCIGLNNDSFYDQLTHQVQPEDLATIIYTSGTTGPPKGVMLTHRNLMYNVEGAGHLIPVDESDLALSFLPLSHIFERLAGYYFMISRGATIAYAESMQSVAEDIQIVRPTVAAAVPRFYEKIHAAIHEKVEAGTPLRKKIFSWALKVGSQAGQARLENKRISPVLAVQNALAKILVFNKIRQKLGGRIRFFISGGAPLSRELAEFFYAADVLILEGYGLTETSPVITVNSPTALKFGTVGRPIPDVLVKIAGDGEILTKSPCVMKGYYQNESATAEAIRDGWFYTGDIGSLDKAGYLKITDRKKDIIVTSGGKNIPPQNIERIILADDFFSQVVVVGDKRNYLVALLVPAHAEVEKIALNQGLTDLPWKELLKHEAVLKEADARLRERTSHLAHYEQIKYFSIGCLSGKIEWFR